MRTTVMTAWVGRTLWFGIGRRVGGGGTLGRDRPVTGTQAPEGPILNERGPNTSNSNTLAPQPHHASRNPRSAWVGRTLWFGIGRRVGGGGTLGRDRPVTGTVEVTGGANLERAWA
jgi:hypothetical protein